jgi:hypothetical protein
MSGVIQSGVEVSGEGRMLRKSLDNLQRDSFMRLSRQDHRPHLHFTATLTNFCLLSSRCFVFHVERTYRVVIVSRKDFDATFRLYLRHSISPRSIKSNSHVVGRTIVGPVQGQRGRMSS